MHLSFWYRLRLVAAIIMMGIALALLKLSDRWLATVERRQAEQGEIDAG